MQAILSHVPDVDVDLSSYDSDSILNADPACAFVSLAAQIGAQLYAMIDIGTATQLLLRPAKEFSCTQSSRKV